MKRDPKRPSAELLRTVTDLDAATIDALYGLEPAFEPGGPIVASETTEWVTVACPYCGEAFETLADLSAGPATYVEDCQVCCQPIEMTCEVDDEGRLAAFRAERLD
jgi:hypothetical protein